MVQLHLARVLLPGTWEVVPKVQLCGTRTRSEQTSMRAYVQTCVHTYICADTWPEFHRWMHVILVSAKQAWRRLKSYLNAARIHALHASCDLATRRSFMLS